MIFQTRSRVYSGMEQGGCFKNSAFRIARAFSWRWMSSKRGGAFYGEIRECPESVVSDIVT